MRDTNNSEEERTSYLKPSLYVLFEREIEREKESENKNEKERTSYRKPRLYVRKREREIEMH